MGWWRLRVVQRIASDKETVVQRDTFTRMKRQKIDPVLDTHDNKTQGKNNEKTKSLVHDAGPRSSAPESDLLPT